MTSPGLTSQTYQSSRRDTDDMIRLFWQAERFFSWWVYKSSSLSFFTHTYSKTLHPSHFSQNMYHYFSKLQFLHVTFLNDCMDTILSTTVKHSSSIRGPRINAPLNLSGDGITSLTSTSDIISLQVSLPQLIIDRSINMSLTHKLRLIFEPFNEAIIQH